jgi:preprotein translocase subunit SecD
MNVSSYRAVGAAITVLFGSVAGVVIVAGFVAPDWTFTHIGVVGFVGAVALELVCAVVANVWDLPQIIREGITT